MDILSQTRVEPGIIFSDNLQSIRLIEIKFEYKVYCFTSSLFVLYIYIIQRQIYTYIMKMCKYDEPFYRKLINLDFVFMPSEV
jgi:hypothetical protein